MFHFFELGAFLFGEVVDVFEEANFLPISDKLADIHVGAVFPERQDVSSCRKFLQTVDRLKFNLPVVIARLLNFRGAERIVKAGAGHVDGCTFPLLG